MHHDFGMNMTAPEGVEGNNSLRWDADYVYTLISHLSFLEECWLVWLVSDQLKTIQIDAFSRWLFIKFRPEHLSDPAAVQG